MNAEETANKLMGKIISQRKIEGRELKISSAEYQKLKNDVLLNYYNNQYLNRLSKMSARNSACETTEK